MTHSCYLNIFLKNAVVDIVLEIIHMRVFSFEKLTPIQLCCHSNIRKFSNKILDYIEILTILQKTFLFSCSSVLINSMESTEVDQGPVPGSRPSTAIYYIIFFIIFPFFFVNIFVALIIITFQEQGESELEDQNLDKNQVGVRSYPSTNDLHSIQYA